jgi:DNA-binding transcriptional LysR family regulator
MHISRVDLNLFTVFDAIYREGGITPASKRLHLSQPAVSHALARLRDLLDDPLFERRGNEMIPTPKARALAATIVSSIGNLEHVLNSAGHFDPATNQRTFRIAVRESHEASFLPQMLADISRAAPLVDIAAVRIHRRELEEDLQSGELDAAVDVALPLSSEVRRELLSSEPLVVLARHDHSAIRGALNLETYLSLEHVLVTGRRRGGGYEDAALARQGVSRRVRLRCQHHAAANEVVNRSDLILTVSQGHAEVINRDGRNQVLPFPLEITPLELFLYWHANVDEDPAGQWFRRRLIAMLVPQRG